MDITILTAIQNHNNGNTIGKAAVDGQTYFYKLVQQHAMEREQAGHKAVAPFYPVAALHDVRPYDGRWLLLYEYLESVEGAQGMLADVIDTPACYEAAKKVATMYQQAFAATADWRVSHDHDIFFTDRVAGRLSQFYTDEFIATWSGRDTVINGVSITINLGAMLDAIRAFFATEHDTPKLCVISQCDPAEYNLATKPVLLDYDTGGYNPLMAEFATLTALTAFFGDYLARAYNPDFFTGRGLTAINWPVRDKNGIHRHLSAERQFFLRHYVNTAITPRCPQLLPLAMREEFRNYFAMKLLAVFNISSFNTLQQEYLLGCLQYVYDMCMAKSTPASLLETCIWN